MEFEWDEVKRRHNIKDHKIDFPSVLSLFEDPHSLLFKDDRFDYGEPRFILLGLKEGLLFQVAYTLRGNAFRIISARRGNKRERRHYDQAKKN